MNTLIAVALGGALGSVCRYLLDYLINTLVPARFPFATLAVNLLGCLLIGFLWGYFGRIGISHNFRLFLFTGFLGGLTTFSTFARESEQLLSTGNAAYGIIYIVISNLAGIGFVALGFFLCSRYIR